MSINWKVRAKNVWFWVALAGAVSAPMFAGVGVSGADMTSWPILFDTIVAALSNPAVVVAMLAAAVGVINDPTTAGLADSSQALAYSAPKVDGKHVKLNYVDDEEAL